MQGWTTTVAACALALGAAPAAGAATTTCPPAGTDHLGYSAQLGSDTVSVIDLAAQRSIDQLTGFDYPFNAEVSPDGRRLYVDNSPIGQNDKDTFQIVDLCSRTPIKTIKTGGPAFSSITNDGHYVYNVPPGGPIRRFDTGNDRETSTPTDDPDVFYAVSTDGKVVWLEDANLADPNHAGYAYAIDGDTGKVLSPRVQIGFEPVVAQMTPDGSKLVTFNLGSSVSIVDTKTYQVTTVDTGPSSAPAYGKITSDSRYAWVGDYGGSLYVIDLRSGSIVKTIDAGGFAVGVSYSHDEKQVYVSTTPGGTVPGVGLANLGLAILNSFGPLYRPGGVIQIYDRASMKKVNEFPSGAEIPMVLAVPQGPYDSTACAGRHALRIRLRTARGARIRSVRARVAGRHARVTRTGRTVRVHIRKAVRSRKAVRVVIRAELADGRTVRSTRVLHPCRAV